MNLCRCLIITLGAIVLVFHSSESVSVFTTSKKRPFDLNNNGLSIAEAGLNFSVTTCSNVSLLLAARKTGTPEYVLSINQREINLPNEVRTVLFRIHGNKNNLSYSSVMVLQQSRDLCHSRPLWFFARFYQGLFTMSETCNQRKNFIWAHTTSSEVILRVTAYSSLTASWKTADKPVCHGTNNWNMPPPSSTHDVGFFKLKSMEFATNRINRPLINDRGFEFKDANISLEVQLHSCELAVLTLAQRKETVFTNYYGIFLNEYHNRTRTYITSLRRCQKRKCTTVGSIAPSESIKTCRASQKFLIKVRPGEIALSTCNVSFSPAKEAPSHNIHTSLQPSGHKPSTEDNLANFHSIISETGSESGGKAQIDERGNETSVPNYNNSGGLSGTDGWPPTSAAGTLDVGITDKREDEKDQIGQKSEQFGQNERVSLNPGQSKKLGNAGSRTSIGLYSVVLPLLMFT